MAEILKTYGGQRPPGKPGYLAERFPQRNPRVFPLFPTQIAHAIPLHLEQNKAMNSSGNRHINQQ
jgi:hypothetical protein